ncbi:transcription termination factor Rho [Atopobacter phocae]|uniref:transcription termination factor Rho n=1 Tax=Atopobacter phocae TaxID=136492 RepID=UPI000470FD8F|nr:transcription termination factor Rho [Atopobacter phocae]
MKTNKLDDNKEKAPNLTLKDLEQMTLKEIYNFAREFKIPYYSKMTKKELSLAVVRAQEEEQGFFQVEGVLDIMHDESFGFLRPINYSSSPEDIYISNSQIRRFELRNGDRVIGIARPPKTNERYNGLMKVMKVNNRDPEKAKNRDHFPALTPIYPNQFMKLETKTNQLAPRIIDLVAPIGFGQRAMIVAPPKAGKTTVLKQIAQGIRENHPDAELIILLIDERPEEVTDIERSVDADVVSSTFDQPTEHHVKVAELVLERAMRLVEDERDVIILMDSLTRLTRAYNLITPPSGRTLSGGIDPAAFYYPKRFFGAARNIEEGGSLTILATALVETGSRMDDVIFEEFKGTGNAEIQLSREMAQKRIFPALDVRQSSTRREDLLLTKDAERVMWNVRNKFTNNHIEESERFIRTVKKYETNEEFLKQMLSIIESKTKK